MGAPYCTTPDLRKQSKSETHTPPRLPATTARATLPRMSTDERALAAREQRAAAFGRAAHLYAAIRPAYPPAAVEWLVPDAATVVVDLGAGTGKLTSLLTREDRHVIAVEPSALMRAELQAAVPTATALAGTSDRIDLPDASVDAVVVAQAWHWFPQPASSHEIARILKPGGTLGIVWNIRDDSVPWMARFSALIHGGDHADAIYGRPALTGEFGPLDHCDVPWHDRCSPADLRALAATRSNVITLDDVARESLLSRVDDLAATDPALAGKDSIAVPYTAACWRATRL